MTATRQGHLDEFYRLLADLARREHGPRQLACCTGHDGWPRRGVYFFFEEGETRLDSTSRVVRVGTHALRPSDQTSLWGRLRQHRGQIRGRNPGGGNHRASIFRGHVGTALIQRDHLPGGLPTRGRPTPRPALGQGRRPARMAVSQHIRAMPFLWLAVPTRPDGSSDRALIERNASPCSPARPADPTPPAPAGLAITPPAKTSAARALELRPHRRDLQTPVPGAPRRPYREHPGYHGRTQSPSICNSPTRLTARPTKRATRSTRTHLRQNRTFVPNTSDA